MASDNYFFLVPQIVPDEKYFDTSIPEILRGLDGSAGKFNFTAEHVALDEYGADYGIVLRLNISCQSNIPEGWTISLKLHNERIDGIDWEPKYEAFDRTSKIGWHRHQWNQRSQSAKDTKLPLAELDDVDSREQFVIRSLSIMRITVSSRDYGDQLSLAEGRSA
jgi:hypothetical protein